MTHTAKHTPGPLHNGQPSLGQPCTCCILLRTGEPLESIHGNQPCSDISRIELCPKHAAAPAMYEALQAIEARLQGVFDSPALMRQGMLTHDKSADVIRFVRAAIAQAEGR